ncbi:hypothetical protein M433DRAFT_270802 [Acidomyces richmondensis BFW]|nr:MAG: hypothetical protein FE78DRAFT_80631 [Acidomyces sp. 'richmondensis']KYG45100.1 hypothetical protein M433DRAFT_270802 [Acidomyces richmondensis BFW]
MFKSPPFHLLPHVELSPNPSAGTLLDERVMPVHVLRRKSSTGSLVSVSHHHRQRLKAWIKRRSSYKWINSLCDRKRWPAAAQEQAPPAPAWRDFAYPSGPSHSSIYETPSCTAGAIDRGVGPAEDPSLDNSRCPSQSHIPASNIRVRLRRNCPSSVQSIRSTRSSPNIYPPSPTYPRLSLLGLPGELRNKIYRHVLVSPRQPLRVKQQTCNQPALLQTCTQARYEALTIYYLENRFRLPCIDDDTYTFCAF